MEVSYNSCENKAEQKNCNTQIFSLDVKYRISLTKNIANIYALLKISFGQFILFIHLHLLHELSKNYIGLKKQIFFGKRYLKKFKIHGN